MSILRKTLLICFGLLLLSCSNSKKLSTKSEFVHINTTYGDIYLKLYNETPVHKANFIKLIKEGFYDGTLFHRIIDGFMIQGGDPTSKNAQPAVTLGNGEIGYTIPHEIKSDFIHVEGALAAARMGDGVNPQKASSGCQFYIVQGKPTTQDQLLQLENRKKSKNPNFSYTKEQKEAYLEKGGTPFLDGDYTVFGEVVKGIEVVRAIAKAKTDRRNRPREDIKMTVKLVSEVG